MSKSPNPTTTVYIRVHPLDPKRGYKARRYGIYDTVFHEEKGWYRAEFTSTQIAVLKSLRANENPESTLVFEILTPEEKKNFDRAEAIKKRKAAENALEV